MTADFEFRADCASRLGVDPQSGSSASGLKTGNNTIEFSNTGREPHHLIAVPYKPGATLGAVRKAFKAQSGAEPPLDFEHASYTGRIDGGTKQITELQLDEPAKYALLCFVSDRKGGPSHVAQGMIAEATVRRRARSHPSRRGADTTEAPWVRRRTGRGRGLRYQSRLGPGHPGTFGRVTPRGPAAQGAASP